MVQQRRAWARRPSKRACPAGRASRSPGPAWRELGAALVLDLEGGYLVSWPPAISQGARARPQALRHGALDLAVTRTLGWRRPPWSSRRGRPTAVALGGLRRGIEGIRAGVVLAPGRRSPCRDVFHLPCTIHLIRAARREGLIQRRQGLVWRADAEGVSLPSGRRCGTRGGDQSYVLRLFLVGCARVKPNEIFGRQILRGVFRGDWCL